MTVLDLFCGAGGASVGMHRLGLEVLGVDADADACATHEAAGFMTVLSDVRHRPAGGGTVDGIWASPPCTAFSAAGKRAGVGLAEELVHCIITEVFADWDEIRPDVWLILPTMAAIQALRPRWVAMENVRATMPVMEACAEVLRRWGYETEVALLQAEEYGVAQTRTRAFLMARSDGPVKLLPPICDRYRKGKPGTWVSMADALGWGSPRRPFYTFAPGTGEGGGMDPVGGSGARRGLMALAEGEDWVLNTGRDWNIQLRGTAMPNATVRTPDEPAMTVGFGKSATDTKGWVWERPSTTVAGDPRVWPPGHKVNQADRDRHADADERYGVRGSRDTIKLSVAEAARLQAFPDGHPFLGSKTSCFRQVGNAVPPPLAIVVAGAAAGIDPSDVELVLRAYLEELYS